MSHTLHFSFWVFKLTQIVIKILQTEEGCRKSTLCFASRNKLLLMKNSTVFSHLTKTALRWQRMCCKLSVEELQNLHDALCWPCCFILYFNDGKKRCHCCSALIELQWDSTWWHHTRLFQYRLEKKGMLNCRCFCMSLQTTHALML